MTLGIEEQILRLNITMSHALTMKICNTRQNLLKTALDFAGRHATSLDSCVEVSTWTELHQDDLSDSLTH